MTGEDHGALSRRGFLLGGCACCAGLLGPAIADAAAVPQSLPSARPRRLVLVHPYSDESFAEAFWDGERPIERAVREIERLFRDRKSGRVHEIDVDLLHLLADLQEALGGRALEVISGYRAPEARRTTSRTSPVARKRSFHLSGRAVDIRVPGVPLQAAERAALQLQRGGVGSYRQRRLLHVDVGPLRHWRA